MLSFKQTDSLQHPSACLVNSCEKSSLLHPLHSRGSVMTLLAPRDKHGIHHFCTKTLSWIHNSEPALESSIF